MANNTHSGNIKIVGSKPDMKHNNLLMYNIKIKKYSIRTL